MLIFSISVKKIELKFKRRGRYKEKTGGGGSRGGVGVCGHLTLKVPKVIFYRK